MIEPIHIRARKFLQEFFNDDDLTIFCFDYFRQVYNNFAQGMLKSQKVLMLVEYSQRHNQFDELLAALERERPKAYTTHFPEELSLPTPLPKTPAKIERNPRQIFMSHAHEDVEIVRQLADDLKVHDWQIWMAPDSIRPGEKWQEAIDRGLNESGKLLLVLTPEAAASDAVRDETNAAIIFSQHGEQIEILPLDMKPVSPTAMPYTWVTLQHISFSDDYKNGLENLLKTMQPEMMARLNSLDDQLQQAFERKEWAKVDRVGQEILNQYPDYRDTVQMMTLAGRRAKRETALREEAEKLYQQLQEAIRVEMWDDASRLITDIQGRVKNYRNVAQLSTMVQQKQRQQDKQERRTQPSIFKRLPGWSWLILLAPFAVWGLLSVFRGNGNGDVENEIAALNATATAQTLAFEATLTARPMNQSDDPTPIQQPVKTATTASEPTEKSAETATNEPVSTATMLPTVTQTVDPNVPSENAELGSKWTRPIDGMEMVFVPEGTFMMGSDPDEDANAVDDEQPQHEVTLDSYWIDRTEVTNAQFAAFLNDRGNHVEGDVTWLDIEDEDALIEFDGGDFIAKSGFNDHPVIEVSWYGANAYCQWTEGALPTEAQWEYAARGNDVRIYPWGNQFDGTKVNYCDSNCSFDWADAAVDDGFSLTAPVGSFSPAGDSWVDAVDMAGNVWEWVADWYESDYYENTPANDPTGPESGNFKVLRGGGWFSVSQDVRVATRSNNTPDNRYYNLGFRCAQPPGN